MSQDLSKYLSNLTEVQKMWREFHQAHPNMLHSDATGTAWNDGMNRMRSYYEALYLAGELFTKADVIEMFNKENRPHPFKR